MLDRLALESIRYTLARMYDNIADMDAQVGEILKELADDGLGDSTIVFYDPG